MAFLGLSFGVSSLTGQHSKLLHFKAEEQGRWLQTVGLKDSARF